MNIHIVKQGETVSSIAQQYGVPQFIVTTLNNLENISNERSPLEEASITVGT